MKQMYLVLFFRFFCKLTKIAQECIGGPNMNLAFQSLLFKHQLQKNLKIAPKDEDQINDTTKEEEIISSVTSYMPKNWPIKEYIDRNHAVKSLSTQFNKFEKNYGEQDLLFAHLYGFMDVLHQMEKK